MSGAVTTATVEPAGADPIERAYLKLKGGEADATRAVCLVLIDIARSLRAMAVGPTEVLRLREELVQVKADLDVTAERLDRLAATCSPEQLESAMRPPAGGG